VSDSELLQTIAKTLEQVQADTRKVVLSLHGGQGPDGSHRVGLIDEFCRLKDRVTALEKRAEGHGSKIWAVCLAAMGAVIIRLIDLAARHIK